MYLCQRALRTAFAVVALAVTAGCTGGTRQLDPEPSWYRAEHGEASVGSRLIGYGSGPNEEIARAIAQEHIVRQRHGVKTQEEVTVRERAGTINGEEIDDSYAERNITSYGREQTLTGVKRHKGPTVIGNTVYIALVYNDEPMSQIIQNRIRSRCQSRTRSPHPRPSSKLLRRSVKFARDLERETDCRDYELVYHQNLWQVVVGGERESLSVEMLREYFFPSASGSAMRIFDADNGTARSRQLKDGDYYMVRFRESRGSRRYIYWLYVDALGRVVSLNDLVVREKGKEIGVGTKAVPLQAHLNDRNVTRATEYILRLACTAPLDTTIIGAGDTVPSIEYADYYKLGAILSETTDSCRWDGTYLTIHGVG